MRDLEISKELLSEVLKLEVVKHSLFNKSNNSFNITYMQSEDSLKSSWMPINIYEFVFQCREWAWNNFRLNIFIEKHSFDLYEASVKVCSLSSGLGPYNSFIDCYKRENTEIEAIVKACECIMKKVKGTK